VLGREQIAALLDACLPTHRLLVTTVLNSGLRISEALGLIWGDIDFAAGVIHVRKQLSVPSGGERARRVPLKTKASQRDIPLVEQLARLLAAQRDARRRARNKDWVFMTRAGSAHAQRNVTRRGLRRAARLCGIDDDGWPPLRFHDLRHTFASHLIIDMNLDVAQVSRILGHAHISTTLDIYTHLFDQRRHTQALRERMSASVYAALLEAPAS
jgi:integrase